MVIFLFEESLTPAHPSLSFLASSPVWGVNLGHLGPSLQPNKPAILNAVSTGCAFSGFDHFKDVYIFLADLQNLELPFYSTVSSWVMCLSPAAAPLPQNTAHHTTPSGPPHHVARHTMPHSPPHHTACQKDKNVDAPTMSSALGSVSTHNRRFSYCNSREASGMEIEPRWARGQCPGHSITP